MEKKSLRVGGTGAQPQRVFEAPMAEEGFCGAGAEKRQDAS